MLVSIVISHVAGGHIEALASEKGEALASFSSALNEVLVGIMTIKLSGKCKRTVQHSTAQYAAVCLPASIANPSL